MSDQQPTPQPSEDIERIRQKRLAKLEQLQKAQEAERQASSSGSDSAGSAAAPGPAVVKPVETPKPITIAPKPAPAAQTAPAAPTPVKRTPRPAQTLEDWEDKTICQIFRVTVQRDNKNPEYHVLESMRNELEEQEAPLRLSVSSLDSVILSLGPELKEKFIPADYLLGSWRRAVAIQRSLRESKPAPEKTEILSQVRRICISYLGYCFTLPDVFEQCQYSGSLAKYLLKDPENTHGMSVELLNDLATSLEANEQEGDSALREVFQYAVEELRTGLSELNITDDYKPYLDAFLRISGVKILGSLMCKHPNYVGEKFAAGEIEKKSLLGPILRVSPIQNAAAQKYFALQNAANQGRIVNDATRALRLTYGNIKNIQFQIVNNLVRISPECRNRTLDFFARVMNVNHKRTAMQIEPGTVSSDGFMVNLSILLTRFCEPFIDTNFTKIGKVEVEYFRRNPRLDIADETKLNADEQTSKAYYSEKLEGSSNFISEIFFLAVAANHYGILAAQNTHDILYRDISEMEKTIQRLKLEIQKLQGLGNPTVVIWQRNLNKMEERVRSGHAYRLALETILWDAATITPFLNFSRFLTAWILRLISPNRDYPQNPIVLPLPETPPTDYSNLPEYLVEITGDWFAFISRNFPTVALHNNELITFAITFLRMSSYVKNPQVKTKLVELMYYGTQPMRGKPAGSLGDTLNGQKFALDNLMNALMNFYIDIESQFYHKFTVRYYISEIIQKIWENKAYVQQLERESRVNEKFFVRFVALLLNDCTYVMDNSLTALLDIHRLQGELGSEEAANLTQEEREAKESALSKAEREATQYTSLANATIKMLSMFTSAIPDAFIKPELVGRLAGMLDYNLETLCGPKSRNLSVKNPEQYHFRPRRTLTHLTEVYLHLSEKPAFIEAVAQDGRSYKPRNFERLYHILSRYSLKPPQDLQKIMVFAKVVEETKRALEEGEEELGEIPDEFLDPILATLMTDPVILPSSKVTMDRTAISGIVLSDGKDPYNRSPLTMEMVIPNTELKARIDAFIASKRAERAQARVAANLDAGGGQDDFGSKDEGEPDAMDVDE